MQDLVGKTPAVQAAAQCVLFLAIPLFAAQGAWLAFQFCLFAIFTMYGGVNPRVRTSSCSPCE